MLENARYYDVVAPQGCDSPMQVANFLAQLDARQMAPRSSDEVVCLRIAPPTPKSSVNPLFNLLAEAFEGAGLQHNGFGKNQASVRYFPQSQHVLVASTDLANVLERTRVSLRNRADALSM